MLIEVIVCVIIYMFKDDVDSIFKVVVIVGRLENVGGIVYEIIVIWLKISELNFDFFKEGVCFVFKGGKYLLIGFVKECKV